MPAPPSPSLFNVRIPPLKRLLWFGATKSLYPLSHFRAETRGIEPSDKAAILF